MSATIYGSSTTCGDDATSITMTNNTCFVASSGFSSFNTGPVSGYTGDLYKCLYIVWASDDCSGGSTGGGRLDGGCLSTVGQSLGVVGQLSHSALFLCPGASGGSSPGAPSPSLVASASAAASHAASATAAIGAYNSNPTSSSLAKAAASAIAAAEAGK